VTEQPGQGPGWSQPPGAPGYAPGGSGYQPPRPPRRRGRVAWWGAGLALAAALAGGALLATQVAGGASPGAAGPTGQAAALNTMLNTPSSPASAAEAASFGTPAAHPSALCVSRAAKLKAAGFPNLAQAVLRRCGHPLRRMRVLGGIHGQFTFETTSGPRTLAYERGVIQLISGSDVVVQAKDGTRWTWVLESNTVIRQNRQQVTASALSAGEQVFAGGPVVSGAYDARLIVIRPDSSPSTPSAPGAPSSPTPAPSPASGS
jgi:hypothetical protein